MYPPTRDRWRSGVVEALTTLSLWLQAQSAEERKEEGGGSVQTWRSAFFSPLFPLKCDCRLLRRNWRFQEQPSLSKLALRATGLTRTPAGPFSGLSFNAGAEAELQTGEIISQGVRGRERRVRVAPSSPYWFMRALWDRASNCQFYAHAK